MSLTAEDIQTKQFHVRFRGFDIEEVDTFLERIAENFALLNDEKRQLKERVDKLEMEINRFQSQEKTFHYAIISAQKIADEMQAKSRREADARLAAVQEEVDRLRREGAQEKQLLEQEIAILKENRQKVKEELRAYLQKYLTWLEQDLVLDENQPFSLPQSEISTGVASRRGDGGMEKQMVQPTEAAGVKLDDLYEKIEIPEEGLHLSGSERAEDHFTLGDNEGEEKENLNIPDLEGDMLFSLEDPLDDEHEPKVSFEQGDDEDLKDVKVK